VFKEDDFQVIFQLWNFMIHTDFCTHTSAHLCTHNIGGLSNLIFILRHFCHYFSYSPTVQMAVKVSYISSYFSILAIFHPNFDSVFSINIICNVIVMTFLKSLNIPIYQHFTCHKLHLSNMFCF
jgi:hypothetical protein